MTTIPTDYEEAIMTTFDARPGTRGARQPSSRVILWINAFVARRLHKGGKKTPGFDFALSPSSYTQSSSGSE